MWVLRGFLPILVSNRRTIALFDFKLSKYTFFILFLRFAWVTKQLKIDLVIFPIALARVLEEQFTIFILTDNNVSTTF